MTATWDERERLQTLASYDILDTDPEPQFDGIASLASHVLGAPIVVISFVDATRSWFKARHGSEIRAIPREESFCAHVVESRAPVLVTDTLDDARFSTFPLVVKEPHFRFYAGTPLRARCGAVIGTIGVLDVKPHGFSNNQRYLLDLLGKQTSIQVQLRRSRALLSESRTRQRVYRHFFETTSDLLATADPTFTVRDLNGAWQPLLGWSEGELRARPLWELVHPGEIAETLEALQQLREKHGQVVTLENRFRDTRGKWVSLSWTVVMKDGLYFCRARALSPCEEGALVLRDTETRLRAAFEAAIDAMLTIDAKGRILHVNPAVGKLFGYGPNELEGQNVSLLMPARERGEHDSYLAHYAQTGERKVIGIGREIVAERKDGTTFPAELSVSEFEVNGQRHFTGTIRDLTARKQTEGAVLRSREEALAASQAKSQFLATMSHEIRTPMNGVLGMLSVALDGTLGDKQREFVSTAYGCAEQLLDIVNDVLDVSKIEAGRLELECASFSLADTVQDAVASVRPKALEKGLAVLVELMPNVPAQVMGDAVRLRQVLTNLVCNAVKFTERGQVHVRVCRSPAGGADILRFSVADTGIGIDVHQREAVFSPFTQADSSTTRKYGGTGLGLTICKQLVTLMGGRLSLTSEPAVGSTFCFDIPMPAGELPACPRFSMPEGGARVCGQGTAPAKHSLPVASVRSLRVLIAEDHPVNALLATHLVAMQGHTSVHVTDGERALDALLAEAFDVVLMDVEMPGLDGLEATRRIRALEASGGAHVPIIALTANAMTGDREVCLRAGMDAFLTKPLDRNALWHLLDDVAGRDAQELRPGERKGSPKSSLATLNQGDLLALAGGDTGFVRELLRVFLGSHQEPMQALAQHLAVRNAQGVRAAAHRLKGALQTIGADQAAAIILDLEQASRGCDERGCAAAWEDLRCEMDTLVGEIKRTFPGM